MTVRVGLDGGRLVVRGARELLKGRHFSQLAYWGFSRTLGEDELVVPASNARELLGKLLPYFDRAGLLYSLDSALAALQEELRSADRRIAAALDRGAAVKNGEIDAREASRFLAFLEARVPRKLKEHQIKAALHLLAVENGANFSVPGSGKTTVVLAVYEWLRQQGEVDTIFVVGPPSCFGPWQDEYQGVFGRTPVTERLAGGDVGARRAAYSLGRRSLPDLFLTSFQTLQRDWDRVRSFFEESEARIFLVVDEAHYIKQLEGAWASAVLGIAAKASRRCVLTGTPFPRSYADGFNLVDVMWPDRSPLPPADRMAIESCISRGDLGGAVKVLDRGLGPLFYRVRKEELGLAPQVFHPPILVEMAPIEREIYEAIVDRLKEVSKEDFFRDLDVLTRLRQGRMTRLRQAVSYPKLLASAVVEYQENLLEARPSLSQRILQYDLLERPAKLEALGATVDGLRSRGRKVLIWSNFIGSLRLIVDDLRSRGHSCRLIYGDTPMIRTSVDMEETREEIIKAFRDPQSGVNVLVANPAACAESVSLHTACSDAIYYDLSYNCAQYLQSLDRIHRVGGSERVEANYYFLQYAETIDQDVLANVRRKADAMSLVIDRDYPIYDLDMFALGDDLEAYERLFG